MILALRGLYRLQKALESLGFAQLGRGGTADFRALAAGWGLKRCPSPRAQWLGEMIFTCEFIYFLRRWIIIYHLIPKRKGLQHLGLRSSLPPLMEERLLRVFQW